jgi:hypothetical protein
VSKSRNWILEAFGRAMKTCVFLVAGSLLAATLLLGYYVYLGGSLLQPPPLTGLFFASPPPENEQLPMPPPMNLLGTLQPDKGMFGAWPGIRQPATSSVQDSALAEDAEVIGITVEGRARAYSVAALSGGPAWHVVNDVVRGRPVSVTYCDLMGCTRVFTRDGGSKPLALDVGGWMNGKGMMLQIDGVNYALKDGANLSNPNDAPLPYKRMSHMLTTWGEWRRTHPDTDVYDKRPSVDRFPCVEHGEPAA